MTRTKNDAAQGNRHWPHRGETLDEMSLTCPETVALAPPAPDEIVARVEAASICSSDIKVIRMGDSHPLFSLTLIGDSGTVLGHELCLRVHAVGRDMMSRFSPGQRLGLQPAMRVGGHSQIIGMDLPGGFAQFLRLDARALNANAPYVFEVPESLSAAEIALLEPYGCVERAWQPNVRQTLNPKGRVLIVMGPGSKDFTTTARLDWAQVTCVGSVPGWLTAPEKVHKILLADLGKDLFDDILAVGALAPETLTKLVSCLATGGLLLQARLHSTEGPSKIDPARVHYDSLAFIGTTGPDILDALQSSHQRFDARSGGTALVLGAGGAMGRIHVHRLLQLTDGPAKIVATSRKGQRLNDLRNDFGPLAKRLGRQLFVVDDEQLDNARAEIAPLGFDDATVIAPCTEAVERAAQMLVPDGLLSVFAGMRYGISVDYNLSHIATHGARLTGSTGCSTDDMRGVLQRVVSRELSLLINVKAIAGLDALPQALRAVTEGKVSGKIVIYPQSPNLPLTAIGLNWGKADEAPLLG